VSHVHHLGKFGHVALIGCQIEQLKQPLELASRLAAVDGLIVLKILCESPKYLPLKKSSKEMMHMESYNFIGLIL
jgi:hypothetical protein